MIEVGKLAASLVILGGLIAPPASRANEAAPLTLESMAKAASLAFAGTVREVNYRTSRGRALTDVVFEDLTIVVGTHSGRSLTLTLAGGYSRQGHTAVVGMPEFASGERCVVLALNQGTEGTWFAPIIGLNQGCFPVIRDSLTGMMIVHEHSRMPLVGIVGGHIAVMAPFNGEASHGYPTIEKIPGMRVGRRPAAEPAIEIYPRALDPGTRVSEAEFLRAISRMAHGSEAAPASGGSAAPPDSTKRAQVLAFLDQIFVHGVPYEDAHALGPEAVPILHQLLEDDQYRSERSAIIAAIAFIGAPESFGILLDFSWHRPRGEVDLDTFQALMAVQSVMGTLRTREAIDYLAAGVSPQFWEAIPWTFGRYHGAERDLYLSKTAINGLSYTGSRRAAEVLARLKKKPFSPRQQSNIEEGIVRNAAIRSAGLVEYIRAQQRAWDSSGSGPR
ncbi:MAG TPA: hypothetical protein VF363_06770 [Candidatus Eisenbacteria bacterium]